MDTLDQAKEQIKKHWHEIVEKALGRAVCIDDSLTREYPWGWVFYFVPLETLPEYHVVTERAYAYDRVTGESIPVGTKGLKHAVHILFNWRRQLGKSD